MTRDELLAAWWVFSQLTDEDIRAARESLTKPPDGGVDAVRVDDAARTVYLVQTKLRATADHREKAAEIGYLTRWRDWLVADDAEFAEHTRRVSPTTRKRLKEGRRRISDGYALALQFVTTGKAAPALVETHRIDVQIPTDDELSTTFDFVGGSQLLSLYDDYLVGVRPIAEMFLPVSDRYVKDDEVAGIEMGIYLVPGDAIAAAVADFGPRLFARNIRGFQGDSNPVNAAIIKTIRDHPGRFRYMNNGITVVCDRSQVVEEAGKSTLKLFNPQVVNGQQTSYTLSRVPGKESKAVGVITKVVRINRGDFGGDSYEDLVGEVVKATNWQTKVSLADLKSNDRVQVDLGRSIGRLGHFYARKTETRGEQLARADHRPIVTRNALADAVGGCLWELLPHRVVKDILYSDDYYDRIFDPAEAERDLLCVYLWKAIRPTLEVKSSSLERNRGKWLVLFHLWNKLEGSLKPAADAFIQDQMSTTQTELGLALNHLVNATGDAIEAFYRRTVGTGGLPEDPTNFFKSHPLADRFSSFLRSKPGRPLAAAMEDKNRAFLSALRAA